MESCTPLRASVVIFLPLEKSYSLINLSVLLFSQISSLFKKVKIYAHIIYSIEHVVDLSRQEIWLDRKHILISKSHESQRFNHVCH